MAQVVIYVGGVLVLILFAIMLTKQIGEDPNLTNAHSAAGARRWRRHHRHAHVHGGDGALEDGPGGVVRSR